MMGFMDAARLFHDCWKIYRQYYGINMGEKDWEQFVDEIESVYTKHRKEALAKDLWVAIEAELERMNKREKR